MKAFHYSKVICNLNHTIMYLNNQLSQYNDGIFANYLAESKDQAFILDLSNATLLEVIDQLVMMKSKMSPNYGRGFVCLKNNLKIIEPQFSCT